MKKIVFLLFMFLSIQAFSQANRADIDRQIEEIMKAREEMIKSLLNDSAFSQFDDNFDDMVKRFEQSNFSGMPGMEAGPVVGEYDWRETETQKILALKVKQVKDKPLDIKIEKGQIKLKGDVESVSENKTKKSKRISKVHFERSFSIPEDVDQTNPEFENKGGEFLIKFKKLSATKPNPKPLAPKKSLPKDDRTPIGKDSEDVTI